MWHCSILQKLFMCLLFPVKGWPGPGVTHPHSLPTLYRGDKERKEVEQGEYKKLQIQNTAPYRLV